MRFCEILLNLYVIIFTFNWIACTLPLNECFFDVLFQAATATKEWTEQETLLLLEVREINNLR